MMQLFNPTEYMQIDIATHYGMDKDNWDDRMIWTKSFEDEFPDILKQVVANKVPDLIKQADEPALFYASVKAYEDAKKGLPVKHMVSLDATASGAQIMAALMKCEKSAALCNVIDEGDLVDFYTFINQCMNAYLNSDDATSREELKAAIMPWFYGSEKEPKSVFGEDTPEYNAFLSAMEVFAPGITDLRNFLVNVWNPDMDYHAWFLPDSFYAHIKVTDDVFEEFEFMGQIHVVQYKEQMKKDRGISNAANIIHSIDGMVVREMLRRCMYDPSKIAGIMELLLKLETNRQGEIGSGEIYKTAGKKGQLVEELVQAYQLSGFLSARVLELIDENTIHLVPVEPLRKLLGSLPETPFHVASVHD